MLAGVALAGCGETSSPGGTGAGSLPLDTRSPVQQPAATMRVLVQFHRPSLAEAMKGARFSPNRQRAYVSNLHDEATATQSALRAKNIELKRPVLYGRLWNGFSATIRARDLPRLQALGLRAEPVRRFFGAAAGTASTRTTRSAGTPAVALLDSARHGDTLATILARGHAGRVLRVRVGGQRRDPATGARSTYATTDDLLAGLERAADPNGNGDVSDHVRVALVGVSSPYAGFDDSPEGEAVTNATSIGTLVVAPAGNEGPSAGRLGTIGSPGAAPGALAVAGLEGAHAPALPSVEVGLATSEGRLKARGALLAGGSGRAFRAGVVSLSGPSQAQPKATGRALGDEPLQYFRVDAAPRARGRVVVVPARGTRGRIPALASRAAAASEAGAVALIVCEPDASRPLPALPDAVGRIPVVGLRGEAGQKALDLTPHDGGLAFVSSPRAATDDSRLAPAPTSSRGPTYALAPKPDLAAPGTDTVNGRFVAGTSIAAARVAAMAARLSAAKPKAPPAELAARLVQSATPRGPLLAAGAGEPSLQRATAATLVAEPAVLAFPRQPAGAVRVRAKVTLRNTGTSPQQIAPAVSLRGLTAALTPKRTRLTRGKAVQVTVTLTGSRPPGYLTGTLRAGSARVPLALPVGPPAPAVLSPLQLAGAKGVRFTAGALATRGEAVAVAPLGDLTLQILDAKGTVVRDLTPQGGARDLLPGEYAYTLTKDASSALDGGDYRFRATAHGPAGGPPVVRTSPSFRVR